MRCSVGGSSYADCAQLRRETQHYKGAYQWFITVVPVPTLFVRKNKAIQDKSNARRSNQNRSPQRAQRLHRENLRGKHELDCRVIRVLHWLTFSKSNKKTSGQKSAGFRLRPVYESSCFTSTSSAMKLFQSFFCANEHVACEKSNRYVGLPKSQPKLKLGHAFRDSG